MTLPARDETSGNQEYRLLEYVERLGRYREGRKAVYIHLSDLKSHNRRDHHLRIAANTFEGLVRPYEGQLFRLSSHDLIFFFKAVSPEEVDEAVSRLRYLFHDDPITNDSAPDGIDSFATWFDVERQHDELLALVRSLHTDVEKRRRRLAAVSAGSDEKPPIDPHRLGALIDTIASADLSNVMRRQTVFAVVGSQAPQPLFRELFISIPELRKLILPNYDITANRWLFQYLTETLDKRMLALLMRNDDPAIANSFSLNLNISTLLSPEFLAFDESLKGGVRGTIVLELRMIDIYADIAAFTFARDFAHDRGYRICLDWLTEHTLPFVDRAKLGIDLLKLEWSPRMLDHPSPEHRTRLREAIEAAGRTKVVLFHVDSEQALAFGQSLGIAIFQGRYIDQLAQRNPSRPRA